MLRLRDIMTSDVITLDPNLTIREAMDVFTSKRISGAPVVAGDRVVGVLSATDLMQFAASLPGVPTERETEPEWMGDITSDEDEAATLPDTGDDDDPSALYFTDMWDDAGAPVVERMVTPSSAEWNSLEEHTVSEAMSRPPLHALPPDALVTAAAEYMRRARIHRVLVMTGPTLVGLVSATDITNAVADGKLTAHTYVFDRPARRADKPTWGRDR